MNQIAESIQKPKSHEHTERMVPETAKWDESCAEHLVRYRLGANKARDGRLLDVGCGVGYGSKFLADQGAAEVVAIDYSEEALEIARNQFAASAITFHQDDAQELKTVDGKFDLITAFEIYEHIPEPEAMLRRCAELLDAQKGVFLCSTPNTLLAPKQEDGVTPRNPFHLREYSLEEFRAALLEVYPRVEIYGQRLSDRYRQLSLSMRHIVTQSYIRDMALWSNPFVRAGRFLQRLRGTVPDFPEPRPGKFPPPSVSVLPPIEDDFILQKHDVEACKYFVAECSLH